MSQSQCVYNVVSKRCRKICPPGKEYVQNHGCRVKCKPYHFRDPGTNKCRPMNVDDDTFIMDSDRKKKKKKKKSRRPKTPRQPKANQHFRRIKDTNGVCRRYLMSDEHFMKKYNGQECDESSLPVDFARTVDAFSVQSVRNSMENPMPRTRIVPYHNSMNRPTKYIKSTRPRLFPFDMSMSHVFKKFKHNQRWKRVRYVAPHGKDQGKGGVYYGILDDGTKIHVKGLKHVRDM